jgi:hypothetical protein
VLEVAVAKGGIRKGTRVAAFIGQWTIAQQQLGHEPTTEEAAAWWKESERTWYRRLDEFREIFDLAETPAPIAAAAIAHSDRVLGRDDVGAAIGLLGAAVVA